MIKAQRFPLATTSLFRCKANLPSMLLALLVCDAVYVSHESFVFVHTRVQAQSMPVERYH